MKKSKKPVFPPVFSFVFGAFLSLYNSFPTLTLLSPTLLLLQCVTGGSGGARLLPQSAPASFSASASPTTATLSPRITCNPPSGCSSHPASAENTRSTQSERMRFTAWSKPRRVPAMTLPSLQMTVMAAVSKESRERVFFCEVGVEVEDEREADRG